MAISQVQSWRTGKDWERLGRTWKRTWNEGKASGGTFNWHTPPTRRCSPSPPSNPSLETTTYPLCEAYLRATYLQTWPLCLHLLQVQPLKLRLRLLDGSSQAPSTSFDAPLLAPQNRPTTTTTLLSVPCSRCFTYPPCAADGTTPAACCLLSDVCCLVLSDKLLTLHRQSFTSVNPPVTGFSFLVPSDTTNHELCPAFSPSPYRLPVFSRLSLGPPLVVRPSSATFSCTWETSTSFAQRFRRSRHLRPQQRPRPPPQPRLAAQRATRPPWRTQTALSRVPMARRV